MDESLSPEERGTIAANLLKCAPPCEFNEVFNDIRILVNDDGIVRRHVSTAFSEYNRDQFAPVKVPSSNERTVISNFCELGGDRYLDPRSKQSFKFDHLKHEASDFQSAESENVVGESWRKAIDKRLITYVNEHYKSAASGVFAPNSDGSSDINIHICIEAHYSKNQATGRWRSYWHLQFSPGSSVHVKGTIRVQTHLFEDGNVQLISQKEYSTTMKSTSEDQLANDIIKYMSDSDDDYQKSLGENFNTLSEKTFKALRRALPVTKCKIDWNKITTYKIGSELNKS